MTRPEHLAALVDAMSPPTRAEIVRAALRGFSAEEHAEWLRLQTPAPSVNSSSALVRKVTIVKIRQPLPMLKKVTVATRFRPLQEKKKGSRPPKKKTDRKKTPFGVKKKEIRSLKPEDVPLPEPLAAIAAFPPVWRNFIVSRRLIRQPMTHLAAELRLK